MSLKKVTYFSDGAPTQYKNRKNFLSIACHEEDFGVPCDWHFFATSHGKGPCDGVGGTVKRLAVKASIQRPYEDKLQTPLQLFEWAKISIPNVAFAFVSQEEISAEKIHVLKRFSESKVVDGTHKLHSSYSIRGCSSTLLVKEYVRAQTSKIVSVSYRLALRCSYSCESNNSYWQDIQFG